MRRIRKYWFSGKALRVSLFLVERPTELAKTGVVALASAGLHGVRGTFLTKSLGVQTWWPLRGGHKGSISRHGAATIVLNLQPLPLVAGLKAGPAEDGAVGGRGPLCAAQPRVCFVLTKCEHSW